MVRLGRGFQEVVAQGLILPCLDLTRVLELLLDLQLFRLIQIKEEERLTRPTRLVCTIKTSID